jgi:hypothetical protein
MMMIMMTTMVVMVSIKESKSDDNVVTIDAYHTGILYHKDSHTSKQ